MGDQPYQEIAFDWERWARQRKVDERNLNQERTVTGTKFLVVCNGVTSEHDTIKQAQSKAEAQAHVNATDAYILKPVRKVAPKRDVVTTDLP